MSNVLYPMSIGSSDRAPRLNPHPHGITTSQGNLTDWSSRQANVQPKSAWYVQYRTKAKHAGVWCYLPCSQQRTPEKLPVPRFGGTVGKAAGTPTEPRLPSR
ncbi:hypothetical protein M0657_010288 [Pyricularia oryzae]|uniref:Uncharacterized protein n=1 Tax=Pyricularia oryzae TaxID=318829 RepID=A0A4P7NCK8_PYROR|nr:hypothetical protein MCOR15_008208 [Pyricularia oryzae]KAI6486967.1 hypothetical protein MCOR11_009099 [Pyricularia oryzae]KAI7911803.1 hypothetical protein M9X92_010351 [Pyricularia oryzae]KAI7912819.1 hypothetical protein M0657_010288 [Pyricularia oryzae]QBZ59581.1 hypothetical protein PoMZ_04542 [Pyricularia oryzae]